MQSENSSNGIARNPGSLSIRLWLPGIEYLSNSSTMHQPLSTCTINLRLAAVRRLAYEAADCGLLSADLAAGIRGVKGANREFGLDSVAPAGICLDRTMPGEREPSFSRDLSAVPLPRLSCCDLQPITTLPPCVRILPLARHGQEVQRDHRA